MFSCEYCERLRFLRLLILKNICEWLLFDFFNSPLLHGCKGLRFRLYDSIRLQGLSHRSSFLLLSWHLSSWAESQHAFKNVIWAPLVSQILISFCNGYFWSLQIILGCVLSFLDCFRSFYAILDHFKLF